MQLRVISVTSTTTEAPESSEEEVTRPPINCCLGKSKAARKCCSLRTSTTTEEPYESEEETIKPSKTCCTNSKTTTIAPGSSEESGSSTKTTKCPRRPIICPSKRTRSHPWLATSSENGSDEVDPRTYTDRKKHKNKQNNPFDHCPCVDFRVALAQVMH
ncbi:CLUMA_CG006048, isoform A [Clunio marinus]|uniref:CLUMA_CG006048, isoform A n=1 Tax=Clunio marinus TaxID=568069 RepID=A0A1J1I295_9DIPT|nr:CLUMA_CG006048, isoform A [Clunio marinus]